MPEARKTFAKEWLFFMASIVIDLLIMPVLRSLILSTGADPSFFFESLRDFYQRLIGAKI